MGIRTPQIIAAQKLSKLLVIIMLGLIIYSAFDHGTWYDKVYGAVLIVAYVASTILSYI
jgi:hypothetical protein